MTQVFDHIRQCLTLTGAAQKRGRHCTETDLGIIDDAAVVVTDGTIIWVGPEKNLPSKFAGLPRTSANQAVWLPALVECHTHLVFAGNRHLDYAARCGGRTYQEIAAQGGGILSTVHATRKAPLSELLARAQKELLFFASRGVGCLEIKSGYGLTLESEIKMLECIQQLQALTPIQLVPTFLPAHAVPIEFKGRADRYVETICQEWIPEITRRNLAHFFDAFVEDGYFTPAQTRRMAEVATRHGLRIKLHVDQFTNQNGTALGVELGATSCDHLDVVSKEGIQKIATSQTVAVLAPGASLFTGTPYPPARALIDAGAQVAITTDFNPGTCPSHNLPLMMTLACSQMKMTLPEAIVACTYNAAVAIGQQSQFGTIEVGRPFHVWQTPVQHFAEIAYRFGD